MDTVRSFVRVIVTYIAALFLFAGGAVFIIYLLSQDKTDEAINLFMSITPVTGTIVAFWFGTRGISQKSD